MTSWKEMSVVSDNLGRSIKNIIQFHKLVGKNIVSFLSIPRVWYANSMKEMILEN